MYKGAFKLPSESNQRKFSQNEPFFPYFMILKAPDSLKIFAEVTDLDLIYPQRGLCVGMQL